MRRQSDLKQDLKRLLTKFSQQILAVVSMAVCTALGYQLHAVSEKFRFDSLAANFFGYANTSFNNMFAMHPIVAMLLLPALFVGGCALGGLYFWNQGDK
jgi:hypothetical protein